MCDINKSLISATLGDFIEAMKESGLVMAKPKDEGYVYGLSGIMEILHVSKSTAVRIKNSGVLGDAIKQIGRQIIVNKAKALAAYNDNRM